MVHGGVEMRAQLVVGRIDYGPRERGTHAAGNRPRRTGTVMALQLASLFNRIVSKDPTVVLVVSVCAMCSSIRRVMCFCLRPTYQSHAKSSTIRDKRDKHQVININSPRDSTVWSLGYVVSCFFC